MFKGAVDMLTGDFPGIFVSGTSLKRERSEHRFID